jgi:hypothetical protein
LAPAWRAAAAYQQIAFGQLAYGSTDGFHANRGTQPTLRGYSLEFDQYRNAAQEQLQYNHMVRLDDWARMDSMRVDFSNDPGPGTLALFAFAPLALLTARRSLR